MKLGQRGQQRRALRLGTLFLALGPGAADFFDAGAGVDYRVAFTTDDDDPLNLGAEFGRLLPCPTCTVQGPVPTIVSPASVPDGGTSPDPATVFSELFTSIPGEGGEPESAQKHLGRRESQLPLAEHSTGRADGDDRQGRRGGRLRGRLDLRRGRECGGLPIQQRASKRRSGSGELPDRLPVSD